MIYSVEHKYVIIGTPRVASTSIAEAMRSAGATVVGDQHSVPGDYLWGRTFRSQGWRIAVPVREHVDWWRSFYTHNRPRGAKLNTEWVMGKQVGGTGHVKLKWPNGCHSLFGQYLIYATDILRYESLQSDLNGFLLSCRAPTVELPVLNSSERRTLIARSVGDYIREWYSLERRMLGYEKR